MVDFFNEIIYVWRFLFWPFENYGFNFLNSCRAIQIISYRVSSDSLCFSRNRFIPSKLCASNCSEYFLIILLMSAVSVVISPVLCLILVMCVLSYFFVSLSRGLSIFFCSLKNQVFVSFIFFCFLCWVSLISAVIYVISFCLLQVYFVLFLASLHWA